jgi:hypothetical protein
LDLSWLKRLLRSVGRIAVVVWILTPSSCHSQKTSVVVGIQSEPMGGAISVLHVVVRVAGVVVRDETLRPSARSPLDFPRPWETVLRAERDADAVVDVEVDAFDAVESETPLLKRLASTRLVAGREVLLRIRLESRCVVYPSAPRRPGSAPGPLNGPTCSAPETCIRGSCRSDVVLPASLEPYDPSWASHAPDMCKPRDGGSPTVQLGTGKMLFSSLTRGQVLQAEPGPQGGHHIWIAVRTQGLGQTGSTTRISAVEPDTGTAIPPSVFAFPFDPDEGGYCQLYGLRYQLDNGGIDYTQFLGKRLDLTATVIDSAGASAISSARIQVAADLAVDRP